MALVLQMAELTLFMADSLAQSTTQMTVQDATVSMVMTDELEQRAA